MVKKVGDNLQIVTNFFWKRAAFAATFAASCKTVIKFMTIRISSYIDINDFHSCNEFNDNLQIATSFLGNHFIFSRN